MKTRHLVYLAFALLGLGLAGLLEDWGLLPQSPSLLSLNRLYLALAGLLTGLLLGPRLEGALEARLKRLRNLPPEVVVAATLGSTVGLLLAAYAYYGAARYLDLRSPAGALAAFALAFLGKWFGYFLVAYWLRLDLPALLPWLPLGEGLLSLAFFWPLRPKAQEEPKA